MRYSQLANRGQRTPPAGATARWWAQYFPDPGPGRLLYYATFANTTGSGMYIASRALYFVNYIGMPSVKVGIGLSVGAFVGLLAAIPTGSLADRKGARRIYIATLTLEALAMCALVFVRTFWEFAVAVAIAGIGASASNVTRQAVIRSVATGKPARLRAHLRSVSNVGITLGGGITAGVIAADNRSLYPLLMLGNALSFLVCAALVVRLPGDRPVNPKADRDRWRVGRDLSYLAITGVTLIMMLQVAVLSLALPLWIVSRTSVPHYLVAALIPTNALLVAFLQVKMSQKVDGVRSAARLMPRAGIALLAGFALIAALAGLPVWLAVPLLFAAVAILTVGEIYYSISSFELSLNLAPEEYKGQYIGVYSTGSGLGAAISPVVVAFLCLGVGKGGWIVLGVAMLAAGAVTPALAAWSQRSSHAVTDPVA